MVAEINFESGKPVKKGDLLLKLDASSEIAQLRSTQADAELAKADFERARDLANRKVISKAELDAAKSKYRQKKAMVDNMPELQTADPRKSRGHQKAPRPARRSSISRSLE